MFRKTSTTNSRVSRRELRFEKTESRVMMTTSNPFQEIHVLNLAIPKAADPGPALSAAASDAGITHQLGISAYPPSPCLPASGVSAWPPGPIAPTSILDRVFD